MLLNLHKKQLAGEAVTLVHCRLKIVILNDYLVLDQLVFNNWINVLRIVFISLVVRRIDGSAFVGDVYGVQATSAMAGVPFFEVFAPNLGLGFVGDAEAFGV